MTGVFCCDCGRKTGCAWADLNIGKVFHCAGCDTTYVHVAHNGVDAWFKLRSAEVEFRGLLTTREKEAAE
jgi:hypothetical protein